MRHATKNNRFHRFSWLTAGFLLLLLLAVFLVTPLLLPATVARLVLAYLFPAHAPNLGSATLNPAGRLILHDLVLHDTGVLAQQPLLTVREVEAAKKQTPLNPVVLGYYLARLEHVNKGSWVERYNKATNKWEWFQWDR